MIFVVGKRGDLVKFVSYCLGISILIAITAAAFALVDYVHRAAPPDKISCEATISSSAGARINFTGERLPERKRPSAPARTDGHEN